MTGTVAVEPEFPRVPGDGLLQFCVYRSPSDFPGKYVVRAFLIMRGAVAPLDWHRVTDTWEGMQVWRGKLLERGLVCIPRQDGDAPTIVEVWT